MFDDRLCGVRLDTLSLLSMQTSGNHLAVSSWESQSDYPDRRQCVRQKIHIPAYANLSGTSSGMVLDLSEILDISERGMCVQSAAPLPRILSLPVVLDLAETRAYLCTTGTVVWSDTTGRTGISFPDMPDQSRQQLKEWLFANAIAACVNHVEASTPGTSGIDDAMLDRTAHPSTSAAGSAGEFEAPLRPDYTSILIALAAVKREVDSTGRDLEKALQLIAERAMTFTRASGAAIVLADKSNWEEIVCRGRAGADAPLLGTRLDIGSSFSGACMRTGKVLRCEDAETDLRVDRTSCRSLGIRSMVAVPVRSDGRVLGLLEVFSSQPRAFIANDDTVLERLAEMAVGAIRNATSVSPVRVPPVQKPSAPPASGATSFSTSSFLTLDLSSADSRVAEPVPPSGRPDGEASVESSTPWVGKVLLMASAATLVVAFTWGANPWVKRRMQASLSRPQTVPSPSSTAASPPSPPGPAVKDSEGIQQLAEQGNAAAQFAVGARYATGEAVPQDYFQAFTWFSKAAEQGNVAAQATLGAYYWAGRGAPQDLAKAYYWAILAQAGGDESSKYRVALLASRLSRTQVLAERKRAEDWIKTHPSFGKGISRSAP